MSASQSQSLDTPAAIQRYLAGKQDAAGRRIDDLIGRGRSDYQLGKLDEAAVLFTEVLSIDADNWDARQHLRWISDLRDPAPIAPPRLLWRCWRHALWELDWLRFLMGDDLWNADLDEAAPREGRRIVVSIDTTFDASTEAFYRASFLAGDRVFLIQLSDEHLRGNYASYRWCTRIWRTNWSPELARQSAVTNIPLGYKNGFQRDRPPFPREARTLLWSFAGDAYKQSRPAMLEHMSALAPGHVHRTDHFGDPKGLSTDDYRDLMERSIYIPSPRGNSNVDCFRVYEALEAGCIPIVEERPGVAYFAAAYGPHPMPVVHDWSEAPALIGNIRAGDGEERLRQECHAWWTALKSRLRQQFKDDLARLAGPIY